MKVLLPDKLGPRKKIWANIHSLQIEAQAKTERNTISDTYSKTSAAPPNNNRVINVNCSSSIPPATDELLTTVPAEPSSSNDMITVVPSNVEFIKNQNNINILQQGTSLQTTTLTDFSSETRSSFRQNSYDSTVQSTSMQSPPLENFSLEISVSSHQNNSDVSTHGTSMQTEEFDNNYPTSSSDTPSNFIQNIADIADTISTTIQKIRTNLHYNPLELHQTSVPEESDSTNIADEVCDNAEEKQRKIDDAQEKVESRHEHRSHNKEKSGYIRANEVKRSNRKGKYYNPKSYLYKIPVPHKIVESRKKLPIFKYKEQFLNVRKLGHVLTFKI